MYQLSVKIGCSELLEYILKSSVYRNEIDPSKHIKFKKIKYLPITWASLQGHTETVKALLSDPRVDPSTDNSYALRWASQKGHTETVKVLLSDPRVDPSAGNNFAIRWASKNGHTEIVRVLLSDPRVDPSADNSYALRWASEKGHTETVNVLQNYGCVLPEN